MTENNDKFSIDDILDEYAPKKAPEKKSDADDILEEIKESIFGSDYTENHSEKAEAEPVSAPAEQDIKLTLKPKESPAKDSSVPDIRFDFSKGFDKQDMRTKRPIVEGIKLQRENLPGERLPKERISEEPAPEKPVLIAEPVPEPIAETKTETTEEPPTVPVDVIPENVTESDTPEADSTEESTDVSEDVPNEATAPEEPIEAVADLSEESDEQDDEQSGSADDLPPEEQSKSYIPKAGNLGAMFTMRTQDDPDESKIPTMQAEYTKKEDADEVYRQILKLKSSLSIRTAVLLFASVFSLFITVANDLSFPLTAVFDKTVNPSAYLFTNTILAIVALGFCYSVVSMGIKNLIKRKADSDSIAAINILAAIIAGLVTLFDPESLKASFFHLYTSAAMLGLLFNTLGKLSVVNRTQRNFEFVSSSDSFCVLTPLNEEDSSSITGTSHGRQEAAALKRTGFVKDFMKNSYSSDLADSYSRKIAPIIIIASLVVGLLSIFFEKNSAGAAEKLFVFLASVSGTLTLTSSFALTFTVNSPLSSASKKLIDSAGVILGYSSVEEYADADSVVIDAGHLFPTGTVSFVNLKLLGSTLIDDCVIYAASLAAAGKSVTQPAFYKMLKGNLDLLQSVKGCVNEDNLGVSGWIDSKRVLLGNRELMESHAIDGLPSQSTEDSFARENEVIYLAISGRAVMMFAVSLSVGAAAERWVQELEDEDMSIYIRCSDGFITREKLAQLFDISVSTVNLIPPECDSDYERVTSREESTSASMFCSGHLPTFAMLLIAAKRVKFAANLGISVQYSAMILGIVIAVVMMLLGSFAQITPTIAIIYELAFLALTKLLQNIRKL